MVERHAASFALLIGIGSNVEPDRWIPWCMGALRERFGDVVCAPWWMAPSLGPSGAPDGRPPFVNGAALIHSDLRGPPMREALRDIERRAGRRRGPDRYAPRTLDLDVVGERGAATDRAVTWRDPAVAEHDHLLLPTAALWPAVSGPGGDTPLADLAAARAHRLLPWAPSSG